MAGWAGAFDHEKALLRPHLAMAMAGAATPDARARLRAGPVAAFARRRNLYLYLGLLAVIGVVQRDFHVVAQVRAAPLGLPPAAEAARRLAEDGRSEEHTSELQSLMRISYAVFCLKKKKM